MKRHRPNTDTDIDRAVRSWAGVNAGGDNAGGVTSLARELMRHGLAMNFAARAAAVMARDGITPGDQWTGPLSALADLGGDGGVKMHRAAMVGTDREVEIDIGRVYHSAADETRALRHARAR